MFPTLYDLVLSGHSISSYPGVLLLYILNYFVIAHLIITDCCVLVQNTLCPWDCMQPGLQ